VIVRGLRTISDFDREWTLAQLYRKVDPEIEVVCLVASQQFSYVSSSAVKEIAELGGPIDELVPPNVAQALAQAFAARRG
jgi:pantetheine-phosphate adenylyltransferase